MGVIVNGTPVYTNVKDRYKYLANALICFMCVYGSLSYYLTAMKVEFYAPLACVGIALISLACASVHKGQMKKMLGYFALLALFAVLMLMLHSYVNSGFSHILNELYNTVDIRYQLNVEKEYFEQYENEALCVTILLLSVGYAMCIVVDMLISESMNAAFVLLVEMVFMVIPLYFGLEPSVISTVMVVAAPVLILMGKNSSKYSDDENTVSYKSRENGFFRRMLKMKQKAKFEKKYHIKGYYKCRIMPGVLGRHLISSAVVVAVCAVIVVSVVPNSTTSGYNNRVEAALRDKVENFAVYGLEGLFSYGTSNNGIMNGKFSDRDILRFDYRTDIRLEYVDTTGETMYVRGYTGSEYTGDGWEHKETGSTISGENEENYYYPGEFYSLTERAVRVRNLMAANGLADSGIQQKRVELSYIGIAPKFNCFDFYYNCSRFDVEVSSDEEFEWKESFDESEPFEVFQLNREVVQEEILPAWPDKPDDLSKETYEMIKVLYDEVVKKYDIYKEYVLDNYLDQAFINKKTAKAFIKEHNLKTYDCNNLSAENVYEAVESVMKVFDENYKYTLVPGKTPDGKDYIDYFLMENKKGYCVHFASAAVIILREMGIPARYAEGYAVNPMMANYTSYDEEADIKQGWIDRKSENYKGNVNVDATDANGHAWTEVYIDKVGWVPVDLTVAADDEEEEEEPTAIQSFFAGVVGTASNAGKSMSSMIGYVVQHKVECIMLLIGVIATALLAWGLIVKLTWVRRKNTFKSDDIDRAVEEMGKYAIRLMKFSGIYDKKGMTLKECSAIAYEKGYIKLSKAFDIIIPVHRKVYGGCRLTDKERDAAYEGIKSISESIYENLKWYQRIVFLLIKRYQVIR